MGRGWHPACPMHGIAPPAKNDPAPRISSVEAEEPCSRPRPHSHLLHWVVEVQTEGVTFRSSRGFQATPSGYVALIFRMSCLFRKRTESPGRSQLPHLRSSTQCQPAPPFRQAGIIEVVYGECGGGVLVGLGPFPSSETAILFITACTATQQTSASLSQRHSDHPSGHVFHSLSHVAVEGAHQAWCWAVPQHTYIRELTCWASPLLPSS